MAGYLIDTDICIDFLRGAQFAKDLLFKLFEESEVYISILTNYELLKGAYTEKHLTILSEFIRTFEGILFLTEEVVNVGAEFYRIYRKKGITLSDIDCLIMATAKVYNLKIVTRNVKHYPERDLLSKFSLNLINKAL